MREMDIQGSIPHHWVLMDGGTAYTLPGGPSTPIAEPLEMGHEVTVFDNTGVAGSTTITVSGPINGGSSMTLTTNYQKRVFQWVGTTWIGT